MTDETAPVVRMTNIVKHFGSLVAIKSASMDVARGEIHALVGENGAGKSTLMNVLYGLLETTGGTYEVFGKPASFDDPSKAIAAGIGMVPQHFKLAPSFSVAENIILGSEPLKSAGRIDIKRAEAETKDLCERYSLNLDTRAIVGSLPVGLRQRVEILKALYREAEILILDEPTAVLTPQETRELFATLRSLADGGRSIIFITHKLHEVIAVSDRISVMRQGEIVATMDNEGVTPQEIASLMVGHSVMLRVSKGKANPGSESLLRVRNLTALGERGETAVEDLSLDVYPGEIVGLAGVQGNGQDELIECIAGLRHPIKGEIEICGHKRGETPAENRAAGLAYVPADRAGVGLSLRSPIWENLSIGHLDQFTRGMVFRARQARDRASELIERFDIRGAEARKDAGTLSGGNQQKVQIARELTRDAPLVLAEQPSQGVDIGAIESIHRILVDMRDAGRGVFVVSADLDEILSVSDRILVMYRGKIVANLDASATDAEELGKYMGGLLSAEAEVNPDSQEAEHVE